MLSSGRFLRLEMLTYPPYGTMMHKRLRRLLSMLALAALALVPDSLAAQDRMVLVTGVELDGEIEGGSRGDIDFDNDELDVVSVDVADIVALTSPSFFEVQTVDLAIYRGSLSEAPAGSVTIDTETGPVVVAIADIVRLRAFDSGFWSRTTGYFDVGANIAQANSLRSFLADASASYRAPLWGFGVSGDVYSQSQDAEDAEGNVFEQSTDRASFGSTLSRYFGSRWALQGSGDWERNEQLDLESRVQFGASAIYDFIETQALEVRAGLGMVNNTERYVGEETSTSAEVQAGVVLDVFDWGDIDVYALLTTFTNLNESGRFRTQFDGRVAWEFIDDFNLGISIKERFDNSPPTPTAPERDFQYGLTLGMTWG